MTTITQQDTFELIDTISATYGQLATEHQLAFSKVSNFLASIGVITVENRDQVCDVFDAELLEMTEQVHRRIGTMLAEFIQNGGDLCNQDEVGPFHYDGEDQLTRATINSATTTAALSVNHLLWAVNNLRRVLVETGQVSKWEADQAEVRVIELATELLETITFGRGNVLLNRANTLNTP